MLLAAETTPTYTSTLDSIREEMAAFRQSGVRLGALFRTMRDEGLYRNHYETFEDFCNSELSLSKQHVYRLISASETAAEILGSPKSNPGVTFSEKVLRPLARLPKEERKEAFEEAAELAEGSPTAKDVQEAVDRRTKPMSRVNGVLMPDPPEIAKQRAAGKIPLTVVPEIETCDDPTTLEEVEEEREERRSKREDDLGDEDWLKTLPLYRLLSGVPLLTFKEDALAYRQLEPARNAFLRQVSTVINKARRKGPFLWKCKSFLKTDPPKDWFPCPPLKDGGCDGTGQVHLVGQCPMCRGKGYRING